MTDFKNLFAPGDILFFMDSEGPCDFYLVLPDNKVRAMLYGTVDELRLVIKSYRLGQANWSGPYRVSQTENFSNYDFGLGK